jgi:hypothetical protein
MSQRTQYVNSHLLVKPLLPAGVEIHLLINMQNLVTEGSSTPVVYIGHMLSKGNS